MSKVIFAPDIGHILQKLHDSRLSFRIECIDGNGFAWFIQPAKDNQGEYAKTPVQLPGWMQQGTANSFDETVWELCKAVVNNSHHDHRMEWLKEYMIEKNQDANQI